MIYLRAYYRPTQERFEFFKHKSELLKFVTFLVLLCLIISLGMSGLRMHRFIAR